MRFSIARGISGLDVDHALPKRYSGVADAATRRRQRLTLLSFPDEHVVTSSDAARALKRLGGRPTAWSHSWATRQLKPSRHSEKPVHVPSPCARSAGPMNDMPRFVSPRRMERSRPRWPSEVGRWWAPRNQPLQRTVARAARSTVGRCRDGAGCARTPRGRDPLAAPRLHEDPWGARAPGSRKAPAAQRIGRSFRKHFRRSPRGGRCSPSAKARGGRPGTVDSIEHPDRFPLVSRALPEPASQRTGRRPARR